MIIRRLNISFAILIFLFSACKKEKPEIPLGQCSPAPNFQPMTIGSYWIYEQFNVDTNGIRTSLNRLDSVFIEKDTLINGNIYAKFKRIPLNHNNLLWHDYWRDSSGYIVNSLGYIMSSNIFTTDTLSFRDYPNELHYTYMEGKDSIVSVEAGNFQTYTVTHDVYFKSFPENILSKPALKRCSAHNVGVVSDIYVVFISAHFGREYRLVRYHIVP